MAPARVPDFATLAEAALEAADALIDHEVHCWDCSPMHDCNAVTALRKKYRIKKDKALKAIRGRKK